MFFTNLSRSVWECKSEQKAGEDEVTFSIKNTKANLSRLHPPLGYTYSFTDNSISVNKIDSNARYIRADYIEEAVWRIIREVLDNPEIVVAEIKRRVDEQNKQSLQESYKKKKLLGWKERFVTTRNRRGSLYLR